MKTEEEGFVYLLWKPIEFEDGRKERSLKVGYTNKLKDRMSDYKSDNGLKDVGWTFLRAIPGSKKKERYIHVLFRDILQYDPETKRRLEWTIKWSQKLIDAFFVSEEDLGKFLWEHRDKYLIPYLKEGGKAKTAYNDLKEIYLPNGIDELRPKRGRKPSSKNKSKINSEKLALNCLNYVEKFYD